MKSYGPLEFYHFDCLLPFCVTTLLRDRHEGAFLASLLCIQAVCLPLNLNFHVHYHAYCQGYPGPWSLYLGF